MSAIWIPGAGMVDMNVRRVQAAVEEYDESLRFGRNEDTGQWCVYKLMGSSAPPVPILAFDNIPHPDDVFRRLYQTDALRHGAEILDQMNRENEDLRKPFEDAANEGAGIAAEAFEWGTRMAKGAEAHKIIVPMTVRKGNRRGDYS
jgi:hypothetical protein